LEPINLGHVFKKYKGMWVTLTESLDTVISADKNPQTALDKAHQKGYKKPTLFKVPRENTAYIGAAGSYVSR
jgi:uncharacterized protein DUF5678